MESVSTKATTKMMKLQNPSIVNTTSSSSSSEEDATPNNSCSCIMMDKQQGRAYIDPALSSSSMAVPAAQVISPAEDGEPVCVKSFKKKLDLSRMSNEIQWENLCIYRIPALLRASADEKLYTPLIISIGPYHRNKESVQEMERHKWRVLQRVVERTSHNVEVYLNAMRELEKTARGFYLGPLGLSSSEFVEMMVLDGCFLLECLVGRSKGFRDLGYSRLDQVLSARSTMTTAVKKDMLMLENQIPLFLLEKLLEVQTGQPIEDGYIAKLVVVFFRPMMLNKVVIDGHHTGLHCLDVVRRSILRDEGFVQSYYNPISQDPSSEQGQHHHIVDAFLRWILQFTHTQRVEEEDHRRALIPCVTELKDAGIKFKMKQTDRFWDVTFENGVILMPKILIQGEMGTKSLLFNLMVFEQCHLSIPWESCKITAYVRFLDMLIDSGQDVRYLRSHHIIEHLCGNDAQAAKQVDSLRAGLVFNSNWSYLTPLCKEVNVYRKRKWNVWRAMLMRRYFHNPWVTISFVAAVFLILLTFGQTFYTIYAYYTPLS